MRHTYPERKPLPERIPNGTFLITHTGHQVMVYAFRHKLREPGNGKVVGEAERYRLLHLDTGTVGDGIWTRDELEQHKPRLIKQMEEG